MGARDRTSRVTYTAMSFRSTAFRASIFFGLATVVAAILWFTPPPHPDFASCERPCKELDWPMICRIKLTLEVYQTFSRSCGNCPHNASDCFRKFCVTADGFQRGLLTANRQMPGPVIQVCENDILLVDVVNRVPGQGFGIHWRGQPQKETPVMDGVPMVTQCPIPSSTTFQYKFRASRAGTHLWHAQTGVQLTDGIFGALIVRQSAGRDPHFKEYDVDDPNHVIVINEWSHGFAIQRLLESNPGTSSASLLINGRSQAKLDGSEHLDAPLSTFTVSPGNRYRFRVAYAGGDRACPVTVSVASHTLRVISLDGNPITPREITSVVMAAGERTDFVLTADQPVSNYWLHVSAAEDCDSSTVRGAAILRYEGAPEGSEPISPTESSLELGSGSSTLLNTVTGKCTTPEEKGGIVCLPDIKSLHKMRHELMEKKVDITLYLAFGFKQFSGENPASYPRQGVSRVAHVFVPQLNNFTFIFPSSPLLTQAEDVDHDLMCRKETLPLRCQSQPICDCVHVIDLPLRGTVELILVDQGGGGSDASHVLHLHGYSFYVVGVAQLEGPTDLPRIQQLDSEGSLVTRNLVNPVLKDTVTVPHKGVSVLRFKADNPGYWLLHDQHVSNWENGFDVIFHVGGPNDVPTPPKDFPRCGSWVGPEFFLI
ncbi:laccase-4 isoform X2 [Cryptotermes secundus]|uniref:laccase-4 isoform X2 n=1 Tax=Cryptotermes secundus TaxID=105785 RepID=UPI000CD7D73D|nr:laccase-4 isoform X2 [Cryptotermes secundus]